MNANRPYRWYVNIVSGNGLMPSGNKLLPVLTQIYVVIWRSWARINWCSRDSHYNKNILFDTPLSTFSANENYPSSRRFAFPQYSFGTLTIPWGRDNRVLFSNVREHGTIFQGKFIQSYQNIYSGHRKDDISAGMNSRYDLGSTIWSTTRRAKSWHYSSFYN